MKWSAVALVCMLSVAEAGGAAPDLVPSKPADAPNYWCTWYAQNYWIGRGTDLPGLERVTNANARDELNHHTVFNTTDGWAATYLERGRRDYIFLIDHGWQTKVASERVAGGPAFFNLVADPRDFPEYAALGPRERLERFNEEIKALGWSSLGLWTRGNVTPAQARTFVEWSRSAGILYWKIDGGDTEEFHSFQAKEELYPELVLEYVTGAGGNLNPKWDKDLPSYPSVYEVGGSLQEAMLKVLRHTDVFRTYDASPLLMSVTTLRRTHDILKQTQQQPQYRGILNVQDDCNVAIGLGVLVASKRHPNMNERTFKGRDLHHQLSGKRRMQKRINEVERFGRWARIAPAFPAGEGTYLSSDHELVDRCGFTEWDTWASQTYGKVVRQSAPAVMARNMPLPVVEARAEAPFVCATTYPNGPAGIATEGRVKPGDQWFHPRAKVAVQIKDANQPVGIAGHYEELVLGFAGPLDGVRHVWAQDLLAVRAADIRERVAIAGNTLTIPGALIDEIGTSAGDRGDESAPGLVLRLEGDSLPVAGDAFTPKVRPVSTVPRAVEQEGGFRGTAALARTPDGFRVTATGAAQVVLEKLDTPIATGTARFAWTMRPAGGAGKKNGFLVLSGDEDATAALLAGTWTGSNQMTLFENSDKWGRDLSKPCKVGREQECRLVIDMDARTARLTVNGSELEMAFSESVTSINYLGFGVHHADTHFTAPVRGK